MGKISCNVLLLGCLLWTCCAYCHLNPVREFLDWRARNPDVPLDPPGLFSGPVEEFFNWIRGVIATFFGFNNVKRTGGPKILKPTRGPQIDIGKKDLTKGSSVKHESHYVSTGSSIKKNATGKGRNFLLRQFHGIDPLM